MTLSDPTIDPAWSRIEALFDEALEQPSEARDAWVVKAAGSDSAVLRQLRELLQAHDRSGVLDQAPELAVQSLDVDLEAQLTAAFADRYRLGRKLGEGGMAKVYLAREIKHDREVVIKALRPEVASWLGGDRFLSEIHIAAQLSHPHILALIDSGDADGVLYYVMPYVGGETLRERIADGPLGVEEARVLLHDLADALAHAHRNQIVHRDLKPENVLVVGGHAFLMDFGVAKLRPEPGMTGRTAEGFAIGTPAYMAPEQAAGRAVDQRADVFAWGLLARESLLGRLSRDAPLATERPDVSAEFVRLIDAAIEEDPDRRPPDGGALLDRLDGLPALDAGDDHGTPARRWWPLGLVGAVGVAAVLMLLRRDPVPSAEELTGPVAVGVFRNETGDSALGTWGRMAGDWITQGLQETGRVKVVPWPVALQVADRAGALDGPVGTDLVDALRQDAGAGMVIAGAYYAVGNDLRFQVELIDAQSGGLLGALPAVDAPRDSIHRAVQALRDRVMGALALRTDERLAGTPGLQDRPPTYDAYRLFERGMDQYNQLDYRGAVGTLLGAWETDTAFIPPLVYAARALVNTGARARADSVVRSLRARQPRLSAYLDLDVEFLEGLLASDGERALRAARRAAEQAPASRAGYDLALMALATNQPAEAVGALRRLNPDGGALRDWAPYWFMLSHGLHMVRSHDQELAAAREMRARYPDSRAGWVHLARALAALGRSSAVDSLLVEASTLPPDTYWSQAAMMVTAGEELEAHGWPERAPPFYAQAETWLANQLARDPNHRSHRYWLGSVHYDRARWSDAEPYFESLVDDYPDDDTFRGMWALVAAHQGDTAKAVRRLGPLPDYERGYHTASLARVAAVGGANEQAIALWSQALAQGVSGLVWLHASARRDLLPLETDPRFVRLGLLAGSPDTSRAAP